MIDQIASRSRTKLGPEAVGMIPNAFVYDLC